MERIRRCEKFAENTVKRQFMPHAAIKKTGKSLKFDVAEPPMIQAFGQDHQVLYSAAPPQRTPKQNVAALRLTLAK